MKEGLQASRRFDLERVGVELIVIQLSKANNKPVIIYVYYCPPGSCSDGLLLLNNSLLSNQESIDAEVRHLMRKKYTALRNYRKNRTAERKSRLRTLCQQIKYAIRKNISRI